MWTPGSSRLAGSNRSVTTWHSACPAWVRNRLRMRSAMTIRKGKISKLSELGNLGLAAVCRHISRYASVARSNFCRRPHAPCARLWH